MKKFIAYFDYLGFKEFIENNDLEYQKRIMGNNFRDIENALGKGKLVEGRQGVIADLSNHKINCINFSDTVVFWTNDDSEESLQEILEVAYIFNWSVTLNFFPARGSLVYGEMEYVDFRHQNPSEGIYYLNSVFGKGLVRAHQKAESQDWSGAVMDSSFTEELASRGIVLDDFLDPYAKKYRVPYKDGIDRGEEFAFRLIKGTFNLTAFKNQSEHIRNNFANHKKDTSHAGVQKKIENTLNFLKSDLI